MENLIISKVMHLIEPLTFDVKLDLISKITDSLKKSYPTPKSEKTELLNELFGAWKDMEEDIVDDIYSSRTISIK